MGIITQSVQFRLLTKENQFIIPGMIKNGGKLQLQTVAAEGLIIIPVAVVEAMADKEAKVAIRLRAAAEAPLIMVQEEEKIFCIVIHPIRFSWVVVVDQDMQTI